MRSGSLLVGSSTEILEDTYQLSQSRRHLKHLTTAQRMQMPPEALLGLAEKQRVVDYVNLWVAQSEDKRCPFDIDDLAVHVSDNPGTNAAGTGQGWVCWSSTSNAIPTLRKSGGIIFSPALKRQYLLKELFAGMGFPSFNFLAEASGVPRFEIFQPTLGLGYRHMKSALGNSQHVANVGVFVACSLASTKLRPELPAPSEGV